MVLRKLILPAVCAAAVATCLVSQAADVKRPAILGVAHVALKTNDLAAARAFYGRDLGYAEPFADVKKGAGAPAIFKINDHQYVEIFPGLKDDSEDRLMHVAFETADAKGLRDYMAAHGVKVPEKVEKDADGDYSFFITDPIGRSIEYVQYTPGSLRSRSFGKGMPDTRISDHMIHAGFIVLDMPAENKFYVDLLGHFETWHGGPNETEVRWVDMRVPDGNDWLEYMVGYTNASTKTRGVMNHIALGVPDVNASFKKLQERGVKMGTEQPKIGADGKWQLNLYDPDQTRAELMEPKPVRTPCCSPMIDK